MKKNIFVLMLAFVALVLTSCVQMSTVASLNISGVLPEVLVEGEELDLSQVIVKVNYTNGTTDTVNLSMATVTGNVPTVYGEQVCTVTYAGVSASFKYDYYKKASTLAELENGGYLYFENGVYETSETINIANKTIVKAAEDVTFKMITTTTAEDGVLYDGVTFSGYASTQNSSKSTRTFLMFSVAEAGEIVLNNVKLQGLDNECKFGTNSCVCTMGFESWGSLSLLNCVATDFTKGIIVTRKGELVVDNCYFNYVKGSESGRAPNAIQISDTTAGKITNNTINGFHNPNAQLDSTFIMLYVQANDYKLVETVKNIYGNTFIDGASAVVVCNASGSELKYISSATEKQIVENNEFISIETEMSR